MILYLMREYHLEMAIGSKIIFLWSAATYFLPVIGAVVADSFVGKYSMIAFGSILSLMGTVAFWLTTIVPQARPVSCEEFNINCSSPTSLQLLILCSVLGLISIGNGGVRASSIAFGADQLNSIPTRHEVDGSAIRRYINWYYAWWTFSTFMAFSCIVYIQDIFGWKVGFGIPVLLMVFSLVSFFTASSLYVNVKPESNVVSELVKVIVAAYRKRKIILLPNTNTYTYCLKKGSLLLCPSEKLRFLNKACVDGGAVAAKDAWSLCTVDQVEGLKTLIRLIPLWSTGMLMSLIMTVMPLTTIEASSMNRKIGPHFQIPAGSFSMFTVLSMTLWVPFYEYIIQPIGSRIIGKPFYLETKQRMGIAILLACVNMITRVAVEIIRRNAAITEGHLDDPKAVVNMSALWLIPPLWLSGIADCMLVTAMNELLYMEFPRNMSSIATTASQVAFSLANLLASFIMTTVDDLSSRGGGDSWVSSNINKGHYDYYFMILACVCIVDMIFFLIASQAYGPCKGEEEQ